MHGIFILIACCCICLAGHAQKKVTINKQEETIYPLQVVAQDNSSWLPLKDLFQSKQVIGLGEATHGTKDFNVLKIQALQFLFEQCGYRSVIFEASFGNMLFIDDYINNGTGNIDSLLRRLGFFMFYTPEIKSFFQWMKDFNKNRTPADKVHVYGMDMQTLLDPIWHLRTMVTGLPDTLTRPLLKKSTIDMPVLALAASSNEQKEMSAHSVLLHAWFDTHRAAMEQLYPSVTVQLIALSLRNFDYAIRYPKADMYYRDSCMAENVKALVSATGGKTVVWAHNGHIGRYDSAVNYKSFSKPMSERLRQAYGKKYYPVGFVFNEGSFLAQEMKMEGNKQSFPNFRVFTLKPNVTSPMTAGLSAMDVASFFIDISASSNIWWKRPQKVYTIGSIFSQSGNSYIYTTLGAVFDGLIFARKTSAIEQLDSYFKETKR